MKFEMIIIILLLLLILFLINKNKDVKKISMKASKKKLLKIPSKLSVYDDYKIIHTLGKEQKILFQKMNETNEIMYITGKAGTGKSFLLKYFVENTNKIVVVVAPTGVAALNIGGQTIHSLFHLDFGVQYPQKDVYLSDKVKNILSKLDTLMIDEISMVRADILEMINKKMQIANENNLPFGGKQIIMFGDLFQLPPVITDSQISRYLEKTYGGIFFFNASVYIKSSIKAYELTEVFRQKDKNFIDILNKIRVGHIEKNDFEILNNRYTPQIDEEGILALVTTNAKANEINTNKLNKIESEEYLYYAEVSGAIAESDYPTEIILKLKVGAQVMMIKNDTLEPGLKNMKERHRWVNGTLGIITYLSENIIKVTINEVEHSINKESWEKYQYEYDEKIDELKKEKIAEFKQYPIKLAWAITIHKAQGMTYQKVAIDMGNGAFECGQTYVALSRCVDLNNLFLKTKLNIKDVKTSQEVIDFMKNIEEL